MEEKWRTWPSQALVIDCSSRQWPGWHLPRAMSRLRIVGHEQSPIICILVALSSSRFRAVNGLTSGACRLRVAISRIFTRG